MEFEASDLKIFWNDTIKQKEEHFLEALFISAKACFVSIKLFGRC